MAKKNFLPNAPLICKKKNGQLEIFDGQHRKIVAEELSIPIAYTLIGDNKDIRDANITDVAEFNNNADKWSVTDAIHHFESVKNPHYIKLKEFMNEYKFNATLSAIMLSIDVSSENRLKNQFFHNSGEKLRTGKFKITDYEYARTLANNVYDYKKYFKHWNNRNFVLAIMYLVFGGVYNHSDMMNKMEKYDGLLKFQATVNDFILNIEEIYNYHMGAKSRVRFT